MVTAFREKALRHGEQRPHTDEEWAGAALERVLDDSRILTMSPPLLVLYEHEPWPEIHQAALDMVGYLKAELELWEDLADQTNFGEEKG